MIVENKQFYIRSVIAYTCRLIKKLNIAKRASVVYPLSIVNQLFYQL